MNLSKNCIIALTMCDKLHEDDIDDLLIGRLTGKSDELANFNFAGLVGVINRTHKDYQSLKHNDSIERKWIKNILVEDYPNDNLIVDKLGINNMLQEIDNLYKKYIVTNWKQKVLDDLENEIKKVDNEIIQLGPILSEHYTDLSPNSFSYVTLNNILTDIIEKINTVKIIEIVLGEDEFKNNYFRGESCSVGKDIKKIYEIYSEHQRYLNKFIDNIDLNSKRNNR